MLHRVERVKYVWQALNVRIWKNHKGIRLHVCIGRRICYAVSQSQVIQVFTYVMRCDTRKNTDNVCRTESKAGKLNRTDPESHGLHETDCRAGNGGYENTGQGQEAVYGRVAMTFTMEALSASHTYADSAEATEVVNIVLAGNSSQPDFGKSLSCRVFAGKPRKASD